MRVGWGPLQGRVPVKTPKGLAPTAFFLQEFVKNKGQRIQIVIFAQRGEGGGVQDGGGVQRSTLGVSPKTCDGLFIFDKKGILFLGVVCFLLV